MKSQIGYHILATVIVLIWGVTFVNSKQLLMYILDGDGQLTVL